MNIFNYIGISYILVVDKPSKGICLKQAKQKLQDQDKVKWLLSLRSNGTNVNGNKLRTYREYKTNLKSENYVKCNMSRDQRRILFKFRSCNLPLAIETGRYTRPKTPVNDRVCQFCNINAIEDETDFLIECNFYSDLRYV